MRQRRASLANQRHTARDFVDEKYEVQHDADCRQDNESVLKTNEKTFKQYIQSSHRCSRTILRRPNTVKRIGEMRAAFTQIKKKHRTTCAENKRQIAFVGGLKRDE